MDPEGDFQSTRPKSNAKKKVYIGNLPIDLDSDVLQTKLIELFRQNTDSAIERSDVTVFCSKRCHAIVACSRNIDDMIKKLHRTSFEGRRLVVQRERKGKDNISGRPANFRGSSWSKPEDFEPDEVPRKEDVISQFIEDEMKASTDPVSTAIVSAASVGLVSCLESMDNAENYSTEDFYAKANVPLSELMLDYGEQDVNWKSVQPIMNPVIYIPEAPRARSQLSQHGKAPIHVNFTSFGYHYGAPTELKNGWSHAQPLPAIDCRNLESVPHYLAWQDGLSMVVKRFLTNKPSRDDAVDVPNIQDMAKGLANQVADAVIDAVNNGGHGYVSPLEIFVYIGSDMGRHRSVVLSEIAATATRKSLRENVGNRFRQPCSVGTTHRDIERRRVNKGQSTESKPKQKELEE